MYYVERVNAVAGEFVLVTPSGRVYFDFNPDFYGPGNGGITNSLRKKFPIPRKEVVVMTEAFLDREWYQKYSDAVENDIKAFYAYAVDAAQVGRRKFLNR